MSEEGLDRRVIAAYALPMIGFGCTSWIVSLYLMKFSTDVLLVSPAAMGAVFGAARLWDAVSDPMAGFWSDRTRSRIGRRRPWMLASAIPLGLALIALYAPPASLSGDALLWWITLAVLLYYSAQTCFAIPHAALGAELTPSHHERTRVYAARMLFENLGAFAALGALFLLEQSSDPRASGASVSFVIACGTALLISVGAARTRELPARAENPRVRPLRAFAAFGDVARNPHARLLLAVFFTQELGMAALLMILPYFSEYILHTPGYTAVYLLCVMIPMTAGVALWPAVTRRYGKKQVWLATNSALAIAFPAVFFLQEGDWIWIAGLAAFIGAMNGCGRIVAPSIQADVIDFDESRTGQRKEGSYFAAWNFVQKAAIATSVLLTGLVLEASGFAPNTEQNDSAKLALRILLSLVPMLCIGTSSLLFLRFRLGEAEHTEIRRRVVAARTERKELLPAA